MKSVFKIHSLKSTFLFWLVLCLLESPLSHAQVLPGAANTEIYLPLLKGKKIGVVAHQASLIYTDTQPQHLVDYLLENKVDVRGVFAPEHGFRGTADAGEKITDQKDPKTQLPIFSLYGSNRKPAPSQLENIDLMVFDLQDVGVRFFTYLSTLHYVMEACAELQIPLIVLDRPNPNTHYLDGPVLSKTHQSFVGMHPVPIVYGMTIGEYAQMINGEKWLNEGIQCELTVVPIQNFTHTTPYELPVRPSPNLPNAQSVALYPSLCLLEPTVISVGRGTHSQFQLYGHPTLPHTGFSFTPEPNFGSKDPKHKGQLCIGFDLTQIPKPDKIELKWLLNAYTLFPDKANFFLNGFERIAGVSELRHQIQKGISEKEIRTSWSKDLESFKKIRARYLIYP
ncbi:MAG: DUF1343 domain-containing protein [Bacteroidetes bacterium]|nr:DUF1343 domain-containing protein [Bacteroidota bacterium]MDA0984369.1 DUF1343 domain-containing protein [Bacteroidota bacterium]